MASKSMMVVWNGGIVSCVLRPLEKGGEDGGDRVRVTGFPVGGAPDAVETLAALVDVSSRKLSMLKLSSKAGNMVELTVGPSKLLFGVKNSN